MWNLNTVGRLLVALAVLAPMFTAAPADGAAATATASIVFTQPENEVDLSDDIVEPPQPPPYAQTSPFAASIPTDPLGLVENLDQIRLYTSGTDTFEMWKCQEFGAAGFDLSAKVSEANTFITPYYEWMSDDTYTPVFTEGGTVPVGTDCSSYIATNTSGTANAAIALVEGGGGWAGPGLWCTYPCSETNKKFPGNFRYGQVGVDVAYQAVLAHEMGHSLHWPHSYSGNRFVGGSPYEYDNAIDVMSGNRGVIGCCLFGTYPDPYATPAINRYAAGWIDPDDVTVHDNDFTEVVLVEIGDSGEEMVIVHGTNGYWTLDTRIRSASDFFPAVWEGVHVAWVDKTAPGFEWGINRRQRQEPATPFMDTFAEYSQPLDHVMGVGDSIIVANHTIEIVSKEGDAFRVRVTSTTFVDVPANHTFYTDVEYLADEDITKGCNPPTNNLYCPTSSVTRGQMAAFLVRALNLPAASQDYFTDDDSSIFEDDINRLAEAGITRGCNPPANTLYCPDSKVSRGQMAAFLVRAFGYTDNGGGNLFIDDDGSIFEDDIDKLGTAGVTQGCNPPANTMFCPNANVTRAQMAAFLHRALTA